MNTITALRNATREELEAAYRYTAKELQIPTSELTDYVAVAYIVRHYQRGVYSGWRGFTELWKEEW